MSSDGLLETSQTDLSRADCILLLVPILFVAISGLGFLLVGTKTRVLGAAAVASGVVLADGLYFNPPTN